MVKRRQRGGRQGDGSPVSKIQSKKETTEPSPCPPTLIPLYDNTDSVCGINYNGTSYFFLKNLQGDVIAITDTNGDTVATYSYDAWGKCTVGSGSQDIAYINRFRYRGYYYDTETGLYYLNSRYYDPETGRFINGDSPEYVSVQGGNLFAYCGNNPVENADYIGFCFVPVVDKETSSAGTASGKKASSKFRINNFVKTYWVAKLLEMLGYEKQIGKTQNLPLLNVYIAKLYMQLGVIYSSNSDASFTISKDAFSVASGNKNVSLDDGLSLTLSLSMFSTAVEVTFGINREVLYLEIAIMQSFKFNKKELSFMVKLVLEIKTWVVGLVVGLLVAANFIPALQPISIPLSSALGKLVSNPQVTLPSTATAVVTCLRAIAT